MITITAIIPTKTGHEAEMKRALLAVADHVAANEPETVGFFISEDREAPGVFTTYERFTSVAAMDRHNGSDAVAKFFAIAQPILGGEVILKTCNEVAAGMKG
jgi:quinol monooxygenase YgiN